MHVIARRKIAALRLADITTSHSTWLSKNDSQVAGYQDRGFSMIEVLVTIVILMIGLLGLAGLQMKAVTAQMESYQRSQALTLLRDMGNRINANRMNAALYQTAALGTASGVAAPACPFVAAPTGNAIADADLCEWHSSLLGAAEIQSGVANVGAMIGARGCITQTVAPASGVAAVYQVEVAWQGLNSTATPTITCGAGQYGADETKRRAIALPVSIGCLSC